MTKKPIKDLHKRQVHHDIVQGQKVNLGFENNEAEADNRKAKKQQGQQTSSPFGQAGLLSKLTFW